MYLGDPKDTSKPVLQPIIEMLKKWHFTSLMFLFSQTNNGYNITNIHCIDLEVVFLNPEEQFAHFILKKF